MVDGTYRCNTSSDAAGLSESLMRRRARLDIVFGDAATGAMSAVANCVFLGPVRPDESILTHSGAWLGDRAGGHPPPARLDG